MKKRWKLTLFLLLLAGHLLLQSCSSVERENNAAKKSRPRDEYNRSIMKRLDRGDRMPLQHTKIQDDVVRIEDFPEDNNRRVEFWGKATKSK